MRKGGRVNFVLQLFIVHCLYFDAFHISSVSQSLVTSKRLVEVTFKEGSH